MLSDDDEDDGVMSEMTCEVKDIILEIFDLLIDVTTEITYV